VYPRGMVNGDGRSSNRSPQARPRSDVRSEDCEVTIQCFLCHDGHRWSPDNSFKLYRCVHKTCKGIKLYCEECHQSQLRHFTNEKGQAVCPVCRKGVPNTRARPIASHFEDVTHEVWKQLVARTTSDEENAAAGRRAREAERSVDSGEVGRALREEAAER
jgi:hypothetical protein